MKKLKLNNKEQYNIYRATFSPADITKNPALFELIAGPLTAAQAEAFPREEGAQLVVSYAAYSKDDEPAGYIN